MIGTITLNPSIDQHLTVRHLVKDDANRAISIASFPGGKGINVSKVIRELGGKTRAFALVGGFAGQFWMQRVRELGIPFSVLPVAGQTRVNTILTDVRDGTQTRVSAPGPGVSSRELDKFLKRLLAVKPKPFLWALGGSLATGMAPDTYQRFVRALQRAGTPCILDTDNEALRLGIKAAPFMVKPNEFEIQRLLGHSMKTVREYHRAAKELVKRGARIVVVSLARRGALFVTAREAFHVVPPRVIVKSHVGAGDSLIGGFVLGLERKLGLPEAARLGVAASVSAVMREAPRLCLRRDIPKLLPRVRIRNIM